MFKWFQKKAQKAKRDYLHEAYMLAREAPDFKPVFHHYLALNSHLRHNAITHLNGNTRQLLIAQLNTMIQNTIESERPKEILTHYVDQLEQLKQFLTQQIQGDHCINRISEEINDFMIESGMIGL